MDNQDRRENSYLDDTNTELEHDTVHDNKELENNANKNLTIVIFETKQDDEVLDEKIF